MRAHRALLAAALLLPASCGGTPQAPPPAAPAPEPLAEPVIDEGLPPIPAAPAPAPAELLATAVVADAAALVPRLSAYLEAVNPGLGTLLGPSAIDQFLGELSGIEVAGIDRARPMWLLLLDPEQVGSPVVLVVGVADRAALDAGARRSGARVQHHRGFAAVGERRALELVARHALSALVAEPPPPEPTVTLLVGAAMRRYGPQLDLMLPILLATATADMDGGAEIKAALEGAVSALRQTELLRVRLDVSPAELTLLVELKARGGSGLAAFFGGQPASSFELMGHHAGAAVLFGGRFDGESVARLVEPLAAVRMRALYGGAAAEMTALYRDLYALTGEMALGYDRGGGAPFAEQSWRLKDEKRVERALGQGFQQIAAARKKGELGHHDVRVQARAFRHRGVAAARMTTRPTESAPANVREELERTWGAGGHVSLFAVVDGHMLIATGAGADRRIRAAIDRTRSKQAREASPEVARAVAAATARNESLLGLIDIGGLMEGSPGGAPLAVGLGFAADRAVLRVSLPPDQARHFAAATAAL